MTRVIAGRTNSDPGRVGTSARAQDAAPGVSRSNRRVREEIVDIHRFLSSWISGQCPGDDATFRRGLTRRLSTTAMLVTPLGNVFEGKALHAMLRGNHGSDSRLQIEIRNVDVRHHEKAIVVATFEAWSPAPPESTTPARGRFCTVVMRDRKDGFEFLHIHETWLPNAIQPRAAGAGASPRSETTDSAPAGVRVR